MKKYILLLFPLLTAFTIWNGPNLTRTFSSGAYDLKSGAPLYREFHEEKFSGNAIAESVTQYKDLNNNLIAERIMTFGSDATKPKFILRDMRSGYIEGAEVLPDGQVKVFTRENSGEPLENKNLRVPSPYVIDGGLTYFFINNWDRLMNGETIKFNFITPAKLDYFQFRVYKNDIVEMGGRKGMQVKLEINSFILRAFVDPIYVTYDIETKKILHYKGISNINGPDGKSYSVEINYLDKGLM